MTICLTDENTDPKRVPKNLEDLAPIEPELLYIMDGRDWLEVCDAYGPAMKKFCEQGFADQELVKECIKEMSGKTSGKKKWPYFEDIKDALGMSVGTVSVEDEYIYD